MSENSYLLDTHLLLWIAFDSKKIPKKTTLLLNDWSNHFYYTPANLWEIGIKNNLGKKDFQIDLKLLQTVLLNHEYRLLPISGEHAIVACNLPNIHKDPFDRMLVAQAYCEKLTLLTSDKTLAIYKKNGGFPIQIV